MRDFDIKWKLYSVLFYLKHPINFLFACKRPTENFDWFMRRRKIFNGF